MMPSCDQIGVPIHFHSSTPSGSASLMSLRILLRVSPRQSPSSAILFEMSSNAHGPWLAPDFFMFSSWQAVEVLAGFGTLAWHTRVPYGRGEPLVIEKMVSRPGLEPGTP